MSEKNMDRHNRWRDKTIGFRMSAEESQELDTLVRLSGLTKQDYITSRVLDRAVIIKPNPRVYKALKNELNELCLALKGLCEVNSGHEELLDLTHYALQIIEGAKGETHENSTEKSD